MGLLRKIFQKTFNRKAYENHKAKKQLNDVSDSAEEVVSTITENTDSQTELEQTPATDTGADTVSDLPV